MTCCPNEASDRRNVVTEIEIKVLVECRVDRSRYARDKKRVAIRRRLHYHLGTDIRASAWPVFDNDWLAEPLRQPLTYQTCDDVSCAARGVNGTIKWIGRVG
jgi:hypothetical protein